MFHKKWPRGGFKNIFGLPTKKSFRPLPSEKQLQNIYTAYIMSGKLIWKGGPTECVRMQYLHLPSIATKQERECAN